MPRAGASSLAGRLSGLDRERGCAGAELLVGAKSLLGQRDRAAGDSEPLKLSRWTTAYSAASVLTLDSKVENKEEERLRRRGIKRWGCSNMITLDGDTGYHMHDLAALGFGPGPISKFTSLFLAGGAAKAAADLRATTERGKDPVLTRLCFPRAGKCRSQNRKRGGGGCRGALCQK